MFYGKHILGSIDATFPDASDLKVFSLSFTAPDQMKDQDVRIASDLCQCGMAWCTVLDRMKGQGVQFKHAWATRLCHPSRGMVKTVLKTYPTALLSGPMYD